MNITINNPRGPQSKPQDDPTSTHSVPPPPPDDPLLPKRRFRLTLPMVVFGTLVLTFVLLGALLLRGISQRQALKVAAKARAEAAAVEEARAASNRLAEAKARLNSPAVLTGNVPGLGIGGTNRGAMPATPKPQLRLQAVFFHPTKPSAIIAGNTVFVGDSVGEFRVTAIRPDSVTLVGKAETKVLKLD